MTDIETLANLDNLRKSFYKAKTGSEWKFSVQKYESNLLINLSILRQQLLGGTYRMKPCTEFDINERGKKRHISALHIEDRIVQRCLCDYILLPNIRPHLIYDNGASLTGKGISFTRKRIVQHLSWHYRRHGNNGWILLCDIHNYFGSMNQDKAITMLKYYTDNTVDYVIQDALKTNSGVGVGIGAQLSQVLGVLFLNTLDKYIKTVKSVHCYGRYNDDFYVISHDKSELFYLLDKMTDICTSLGIEINKRKTQVVKLSHGFVFLKTKYSYSKTGKIIKRLSHDNIVREKQRLPKLSKILTKVEYTNAYKAWYCNNLKKFNCWKSLQEVTKIFKKGLQNYDTDTKIFYRRRIQH